MQYLDAISKTTEWSLFVSNYAPTSNAEEAEDERFYEELQDLLELTPWMGSQVGLRKHHYEQS